ncbi:MAG: hypothetical protein ACI4LX_01490 [Treponema sp.]
MLADIEELNIILEMLNEEPIYLQKTSSEKNSEHKVGQDTTRAISTPNQQNHIVFLNDSQVYFERLNEWNGLLKLAEFKFCPYYVWQNRGKYIKKSFFIC